MWMGCVVMVCVCEAISLLNGGVTVSRSIGNDTNEEHSQKGGKGKVE